LETDDSSFYNFAHNVLK